MLKAQYASLLAEAAILHVDGATPQQMSLNTVLYSKLWQEVRCIYNALGKLQEGIDNKLTDLPEVLVRLRKVA
jgi:hypothetical protein